jgi:hypothetical protein
MPVTSTRVRGAPAGHWGALWRGAAGAGAAAVEGGGEGAAPAAACSRAAAPAPSAAAASAGLENTAVGSAAAPALTEMLRTSCGAHSSAEARSTSAHGATRRGVRSAGSAACGGSGAASGAGGTSPAAIAVIERRFCILLRLRKMVGDADFSIIAPGPPRSARTFSRSTQPPARRNGVATESTSLCVAAFIALVPCAAPQPCCGAPARAPLFLLAARRGCRRAPRCRGAHCNHCLPPAAQRGRAGPRSLCSRQGYAAPQQQLPPPPALPPLARPLALQAAVCC